MTTIHVYEVLGQRATVTREAARRLLEGLPNPVAEPIELDFDGVEAVSPSFVDELLGALAEVARRGPVTVCLTSAPDRLIDKVQSLSGPYFAEVARLSGGLEIRFPEITPV